MGVRDAVALLGTDYTKTLARVYNIDITFNGETYSKAFRTAINNNKMTIANTTKNTLPHFKGHSTTFYKSGDILMPNYTSTLQQVVKEIKDEVAKIIDFDYIIKEIADTTSHIVNKNDIIAVEVSLVDNNCNYVDTKNNKSGHKTIDTGSFEPDPNKYSQSMDIE